MTDMNMQDIKNIFKLADEISAGQHCDMLRENRGDVFSGIQHPYQSDV